MSPRLLLPLLALFTIPSLMAQSSDLLHLRTTAPMDRSALKAVIQLVTDLDPTAGVYHSDDMTILQIRRNPSVSDEQLRAAIAGAGVTLQPGVVDPATLHPVAGVDTEPVYIVTGDEAADLARYQAARELWNANHPDAPIAAPVHLTNE